LEESRLRLVLKGSPVFICPMKVIHKEAVATPVFNYIP